jgi:endonuclease/exonuclease/phosphatase family metal-dependent hydrolase
MPAIVCGDFNATPEMRTIQLMRQRFTSAYAAVHGREPDYTCPTPLAYRLSSVRKGLSRAGNFVLTRRVTPWRGTLDYIFVDEDFRVVNCALALKDPSPEDPTLYPSDHFGLCAELVFANSALGVDRLAEGSQQR